MLPMLYGRASTGKIKQWQVTTRGDLVVVTHGQVGGKQTESVTASKPKNAGRSNATTAEQQAVLEAQSKWNKQVKRDYRESIEEIPQSTLPNLAHKYQDKSHLVDWTKTWESPKLDGVRGTSFYKNGNQILQSRGGEEYPVIQEIADQLDIVFFNEYPNGFVDGELYCHGMYLEDITACVKKPNKDTPKISFFIFDFLRDQGDISPWVERRERVIDMTWEHKQSRIIAIPSHPVYSEQEMLKAHEGYVTGGYEGIILRDSGGVYNFGNRTTGIIKYKVAESEEFKVLDFELDKKGAGVPVCAYTKPDGTQDSFKAPFATTEEKRKALWENREVLKGQYITVDFEKLSKYGKPTKPIGKAFREVDEYGNPKT